jgi:hypothetical protein
MKKILFYSFAVLLYACEAKTTQQASQTTETVAQAQEQQETLTPQNSTEEQIKGYWVGMFGKNKINIAITDLLEDGKVKGYSVVSGNDRKFEGTYQVNGQLYSFAVKEPGDDKYDGQFEFSINLADVEPKISGKWTPYNTKMAGKTYTLDKKIFAYNPQVGDYPNTSTQLLSQEDIENYIKSDLRIMRNEIYARHGYSFKMVDMRTHFDNQSWYIPMTTDIRNKLSEIEVKNVELIKRYEQYAAEYYDEFGR